MVGYGAVDHASSDASPHAGPNQKNLSTKNASWDAPCDLASTLAGSSRTRVWCKATAVLAVAAAAVLVLAALRR